MNTYGRLFRMTMFGESHGKVIGVVVDGALPGLKISEQSIQVALDRRAPGKSAVSTARTEDDELEILSGVFNGKSTGAPIMMMIRNKSYDSAAYEKQKDLARPGHADYTAWAKYRGFNDFRGGGRFSGRATAAMVMAGAVAMKVLENTGIDIAASTIQIGNIIANGNLGFDDIKRNRWQNEVRCAESDTAQKMTETILTASAENDSVGGVIECTAVNIPGGLGEPIVDTVEGELSKLMFAVPGIKGIEFGAGFKCAGMRGSEHNDQFAIDRGRIVTETNHSGGILGGLTSGMPLVFRVAIKPTSSIGKPQKSVNLQTLEEHELTIEGDHDPCIVPRAVPVVEACTAIVLADLYLQATIGQEGR